MSNSAFKIKTLGCKVNQYESQAIRENFLHSGFNEAHDGKVADVYVINVCTVTHSADVESARIIRRCINENPKAKVIVTGCFDKEDKKRLSDIEGIDYIIENKDKANIVDTIEGRRTISPKPLAISDFYNHDRAFVKIQDGCENFCSYCKVPLVRGRFSSRSMDKILDEVNGLIDNGFREIVLTGICLGAYGKGLRQKISLTDLLRKILEIKKNFRIRLSSIEPKYVSKDLIELLGKYDRACKHLHIPLQSGDNRILKLMNRGYTGNFYLELIRHIKKIIPGISITTDILVGFPTETENNFKNTLQLLKKVKPPRVHVFGYSPRPGTLAYNFKDIIDKKVISERVNIVKDIANRLSYGYRKSLLGKRCQVLVESKKEEGFLTGYTDTYVKVHFKGSDGYIGKLIGVIVIKIGNHRTFGRMEKIDN